MPRTAHAIIRFGLTTPNAARLAAFYEQAFGCLQQSCVRAGGAAFEQLMQVQGGASRLTLRAGAAHIELLEFDWPGADYPSDTNAADAVFQHFALVVSDMARAFERLTAVPDWTPITRGGPQRLPARAGGVLAFKFRDPNGHPLELLEFPAAGRPDAGLYASGDGIVGIDHTAISVADTGRSIAFYVALGFSQKAATHNHGIEQARLDGIVDPQVDVIALAPHSPTPHLELLGYRPSAARSAPHRNREESLRSNDVAATRLVIECRAQTGGGPNLAADETLVLDPDGHRLHLIDAGGHGSNS